MSMKKTLAPIFILAALLTLIDQISKTLVEKYLATATPPDTLLQLEYTRNAGIAFGIPVPQSILLALTIILIPLIIYVADKELNLRHPLAKTAVTLVLAGALGNSIDRITNGYVIDFISVWKWPNFNLADIFITVGILLLIVFYAKIKKVK